MLQPQIAQAHSIAFGFTYRGNSLNNRPAHKGADILSDDTHRIVAAGF